MSNNNFTTNERRLFKRPTFDPNGVLVARRELKLGKRLVAPATMLPDDHGLDARAVMILWDQKAIDTYPPGTKPDGVHVLKFRAGGSFRVPGGDGKPVAFRATPGEHVTVKPPKDA